MLASSSIARITRLALLGALSLAAYGCGAGNDNSGQTVTSCNAKPSDCKVGTTCWLSTSGGYACLPAKAGAGKGATCSNIVGQAQCDEGLACFPSSSGSAKGVCMPFCDNGGCTGGEACTQLSIANAPNAGQIFVCAPESSTDAGSDAAKDSGGSDAAKDSGGSDAAQDSGSDATQDSGSDATTSDAGANDAASG